MADFQTPHIEYFELAPLLIVLGVAVLGVLTATLSSWIVQRVATLEQERHPPE